MALYHLNKVHSKLECSFCQNFMEKEEGREKRESRWHSISIEFGKYWPEIKWSISSSVESLANSLLFSHSSLNSRLFYRSDEWKHLFCERNHQINGVFHWNFTMTHSKRFPVIDRVCQCLDQLTWRANPVTAITIKPYNQAWPRLVDPKRGSGGSWLIFPREGVRGVNFLWGYPRKPYFGLNLVKFS